MKTDREIQKDVMDQLAYDPQLLPESIGVSVVDGIVNLVGTVPDYNAKRIAEKTAGRVAGVKAVTSDLSIELDNSQIRMDQDIAHVAAHTLRWNTLLPDTITIAVENGVITLRGEVDWSYQKVAAERALRSVRGLRDIKNHIHVKNLAKAEEIRENIESALSQAVAEESKAIKADVEGNTVRLSGTVSSKKLADAVMWAAWSSAGVIYVDNRLVIQGG